MSKKLTAKDKFWHKEYDHYFINTTQELKTLIFKALKERIRWLQETAIYYDRLEVDSRHWFIFLEIIRVYEEYAVSKHYPVKIMYGWKRKCVYVYYNEINWSIRINFDNSNFLLLWEKIKDDTKYNKKMFSLRFS